MSVLENKEDAEMWEEADREREALKAEVRRLSAELAEARALLDGQPTTTLLGAALADARAKALREAVKVAERHALKWQALAVDDLDKANDAGADVDHVWRRDAHQHKCMGSVGIDIADELRALASPTAAATQDGAPPAAEPGKLTHTKHGTPICGDCGTQKNYDMGLGYVCPRCPTKPVAASQFTGGLRDDSTDAGVRPVTPAKRDETGAAKCGICDGLKPPAGKCYDCGCSRCGEALPCRAHDERGRR